MAQTLSVLCEKSTYSSLWWIEGGSRKTQLRRAIGSRLKSSALSNQGLSKQSTMGQLHCDHDTIEPLTPGNFLIGF